MNEHVCAGIHAEASDCGGQRLISNAQCVPEPEEHLLFRLSGQEAPRIFIFLNPSSKITDFCHYTWLFVYFVYCF